MVELAPKVDIRERKKVVSERHLKEGSLKGELNIKIQTLSLDLRSNIHSARM